MFGFVVSGRRVCGGACDVVWWCVRTLLQRVGKVADVHDGIDGSVFADASDHLLAVVGNAIVAKHGQCRQHRCIESRLVGRVVQGFVVIRVSRAGGAR
jgi:hypothetical protein